MEAATSREEVRQTVSLWDGLPYMSKLIYPMSSRLCFWVFVLLFGFRFFEVWLVASIGVKRFLREIFPPPLATARRVCYYSSCTLQPEKKYD